MHSAFRRSERQLDQQPVETTVYSLSETPPAAPDRRSEDRYLSLFRVGTLTIGNRRELCLIKNVSAGGMMIRPYCDVESGTRLSVELKQGEPVEGTAQWVKDDCLGVTFDKQIDVIALLSAEDGPKPRMPRIEVDSDVSVRVEDAVYDARVENISQGGMKIECPARLPLGPQVVLRIDGLEACRAVVRWKNGNSYGVTFNKVLPLPMLVAWLQNKRELIRAAG
jgi:hypothetical protein